MDFTELNLHLFEWFNASNHAHEMTIRFAIFIANDLFYIMLLFFGFYWLRGNFAIKKQIVKAFIFTTVALLISQIISHSFYHPRPFVMEVGRTLIYHSLNGSFPSDHMLIFSTIAFSYFFSEKRNLGIILILLAWLVAWSRVYLGVHFPLDMLGAFSLAFILNFFGLALWNRFKITIIEFVLKIHHAVFKKNKKKGYLK